MRDRPAHARGLLDPALLARLGSLEVAARRLVEGTMVGRHESRARGAGSEFSQYRPYIEGDDARDVDWRLYARSDRYYVRQHTAETNLDAWLVVDASASMRFGRETSKLDAAKMLAAALAYLLVRQGDRVGLVTLGGGSRVLPARGGERHLHALLHELDRLEGAGDDSVASALEDTLTGLKRRGAVWAFSDLYEEPGAIGRAAARLARAGFDVALFHLLDRVERTLEIDGDTEFTALEGGGRLTADPKRLRRRYVERLDEHRAALRRATSDVGVDFVEVDTSAPLDSPLATFLATRSGGRQSRRG
jgi:uncharacterized protein (DUF58 family)